MLSQGAAGRGTGLVILLYGVDRVGLSLIVYRLSVDIASGSPSSDCIPPYFVQCPRYVVSIRFDVVDP